MRKFRNIFYKFLATGFGSGYLPIIPGTFGTLIGVVIYWIIPNKNIYPYIVIVIVFIFASIFICNKGEKIFEKKDDKRIVLDEIVGFLVSMILVPKSLKYIILGFILFRFFDIIKIPFIKKFQMLPGGLGIVLDDVFAGILTCIILHILCSCKYDWW